MASSTEVPASSSNPQQQQQQQQQEQEGPPATKHHRGPTSRVIYVKVDDRIESIEFATNASTNDILELLLTAVEANHGEIVKIIDVNGHLVHPSSELPANTPDTCYRLVLAAVQTYGDQFNKLAGLDVNSMEERISRLERMLLVMLDGVHGRSMDPSEPGYDVVEGVRKNVLHHVDVVQSADMLDWLGLTKPIIKFNNTYVTDERLPPRDVQNIRCEPVIEKYMKHRYCTLSREIISSLATINFNNWQWEDYELMLLIRTMYTDLGLHESFSIDMNVFDEWLCSVYRLYNDVPFHNFKHCFCVTQMAYALIAGMRLQNQLDDVDIISLLTAAVCHDMDHPGYNNVFQINARTQLTRYYNDFAPLESHHTATAFHVLQNPKQNPFCNMKRLTSRRFRTLVIKCILATDMGRHHEFLRNMKNITYQFDIHNREHRDLMLQMMLKVADISNEARAEEISVPWMERLYVEFNKQFVREGELGIPQTPFMNAEKIVKSSAQIGFIKFVQMPLLQTMVAVLPEINDFLLTPLNAALDHWMEVDKEVRAKMQQELEATAAAAAADERRASAVDSVGKPESTTNA